MANNDLYKLFQVADFLVSKYNFSQLIIKQSEVPPFSELWYLNSKREKYNVIRITFEAASDYYKNENRIETCLDAAKKSISFDYDISFLDIHVDKEEYIENYESYDFINIDDNYYQGVDLKNIFPEIYTAIHNVDDAEKEFSLRTSNIKKSMIKRINDKLPFMSRHNCLFTYIIMAICVIMYAVSYYLSLNNDQNSVLLFLGADYKTLTLGCKEYYRLFTYAFSHASLIHLISNMISLYYLGKYVELSYGHLKFLIILVFSIICGSLSQGILTDNTICIGLSAGIYGLFIVFIVDTIKKRYINLRTFLPTILINIAINFMSTTAWICHLGGAIAGFTIYWAMNKDENKVYAYILFAVLILVLLIKYLTLDTINPLYGGTDELYLEFLDKLGFNIDNILQRLIDCYQKYGA